MSTDEEVILFDLPARDGQSWSLNPWKTRIVLNYKKIPYQTTWLEYPDVEPTLKSLGIPPNNTTHSTDRAYTIPAIKLGDRYIMDSAPIASAIESKYPQPSLDLDSPLLQQARERLAPFLEALRPVWMPEVPKKLLKPRSAEYFERTRAEWFGMPLREYAAERGGEKAWAAAGPRARELADFVAGNVNERGGPFLAGREPSYADFVIVTALHFIRRLDDKGVERLVTGNLALQNLYDACKPWLERSDR